MSSRKFEELRFLTDGRLVLMGRLPRSRLGAFEAMLTPLQHRWLELQQVTTLLVQDKGNWELMQNIIDLFPRYDRPGTWGVDITPLRDDVRQIESLFLYDQDEAGTVLPCRLISLHEYTAIERPRWQNDDSEDLSIDSSGDPDMDLLASLAVGFSAREAFEIFDRLDAESIDRFLFYSNELRRDPEDRKAENLAQDYAEWKQDNQDDLRESLGIKFQIPKFDTLEAAESED